MFLHGKKKIIIKEKLLARSFWPLFGPEILSFWQKIMFLDLFFKMTHQNYLQIGQNIEKVAMNNFGSFVSCKILILAALINFWYIICGDKMMLLAVFGYFLPIC